MSHLKDIASYYDQNAEDYFSKTNSLLLKDHLELFTKEIPENGTILDVGCGSGRDLKYFKDHGYQAVGIDISEKLGKIAQEHSGCPVHTMDVQALKDYNTFHGIWCCASLIFLSDMQVRRAMKRIQRALKDEGSLYIAVKCGDGERRSQEGLFNNTFQIHDILALATLHDLKTINIARTTSIRPDREDEEWLSFHLKKTAKGINTVRKSVLSKKLVLNPGYELTGN